MTFFIEDYYQKFGNDLIIESANGQQYEFKDYQNLDFKPKNYIHLYRYHPKFIKNENAFWNFKNLSKDDANEIRSRFNPKERKQKYEELLMLDYHLALLLDAKLPCYLNFFTKYYEWKQFIIAVLAIFLGPINHMLISIGFMLNCLGSLMAACFYAICSEWDMAQDELIAAIYNFSLSLFYVLHAVFAPPLAFISLFTRSASTLHSWYQETPRLDEPTNLVSAVQHG